MKFKQSAYIKMILGVVTLICLTLSLRVLSFVDTIDNSPIKNTDNTRQSNWTLFNTQDKAISLAQYRGKPVILAFWATWCPYCKKLLPGLEELHNKYKDKGLVVIGVNIKENWQPKTYWHNHEYTFASVLAGDTIAELYGINGTPGLVFINPQGQVVKTAHFSDPKHPLLEKFAQHYLK